MRFDLNAAGHNGVGVFVFRDLQLPLGSRMKKLMSRRNQNIALLTHFSVSQREWSRVYWRETYCPVPRDQNKTCWRAMDCISSTPLHSLPPITFHQHFYRGKVGEAGCRPFQTYSSDYAPSFAWRMQEETFPKVVFLARLYKSENCVLRNVLQKFPASLFVVYVT